MGDFAGSGPGVRTRDGCSVELYRQLPYLGELEPVEHLLPPGGSVLELGCGSGRLTRKLLERGMSVTAVDNSTEMLALLPKEAIAVHADIEDLALNTAFDVVLLASHLINHPAEAIRRAFVRCARRHSHGSTRVLIQAHDPNWLMTVAGGFEGDAGQLRVRVDGVERHDGQVYMTLAYSLARQLWTQTFAAVPLAKEQIEALLAEELLEVMNRVGPKQTWTVARRRPTP